MAASKGEQAVNLHLQEIESLQSSLRERQEYVTQLENRLRALWDKIEGERKFYDQRIKRLEEAGDALYEGWIGYGFTKDKHLAAWRKAKEDKL
jgi:vacuolar-type H+-ATPase subunit I/STV1